MRGSLQACPTQEKNGSPRVLAIIYIYIYDPWIEYFVFPLGEYIEEYGLTFVTPRCYFGWKVVRLSLKQTLCQSCMEYVFLDLHKFAWHFSVIHVWLWIRVEQKRFGTVPC